MFHVQFLVEDKRLADTLRAIGNKGVFNLEAKPVTNVETKRGKAVEKNEGPLLDQLVTALGAYRQGKFTKDIVREEVERLGGSAKSIGGMITKLLTRKQIKRTGRGQYVVTSK